MKEIIRNILLYFRLYYKFKNYNPFQHFQQFYASFLKPTDVVFEVGANIGHKSQILASIVQLVVAIEPQPYCLKHLYSRFHHSKKIKILPYAISNKEEKITLYIASSHTMSSCSKEFINHIQQKWSNSPQWNKSITVPSKTLNQIIEQYGIPTYIKIDVEGFELNVLQGLNYPVSIISFEFTPTLLHNAYDCIDYLIHLSSNYRFNFSEEESATFAFSTPIKSTQIKEYLTQQNKFGDIFAFLT